MPARVKKELITRLISAMKKDVDASLDPENY
jgi:hypothetical protein